MSHMVLMIEDNAVIRKTNRAQLEMDGYQVLEADTLAKGKELVKRVQPDLILLDILLPDGSGLAYCRELLGQTGPRILFLSALNTPEDVIAGLRAGGDDYMSKPYLMDELMARIEALLRRYVPVQQKGESMFCFGPLKLDTLCGRVYLNGNDLRLTPKEAALLSVLLHRQEEFIASQELYGQIWGMEAVDIRTVKQHVRRLRKKLGRAASVKIEAEQGKGYRIVNISSRGVEI